ncbi:Rep family protein, partial [Bacteroides uniformis]
MKLFEIVQQEEYLNMDIVKGALENKKGIKDWLYILHDKDTDSEGNLKASHYHIYCRLTNSYDSKYI